MPEVTPQFKDVHDCPCGCGQFGRIDPRTTHVTTCVESCAMCARPKPGRKRPDIPGQVRRQVMARAGGWCEVTKDDGTRCRSAAEHLHHIRRRSQGGNDSPANLLAVCQSHHLWIHDHPDQAARMGYLRRTESEPTPT